MSKTQIEIMPASIFLDSGLREIILPTKLKKISGESFSGTINLRNITISESIIEIGNRAFYKSGLTNITFHNGLEKIGYMAFAGCTKLKSIEKTSGDVRVKGYLGIGAFQNCSSLTDATLPDNISRIEGYTFIECERLKTISLPSKLESIGEQGLRTNYDLKTIIFNSKEIPYFINEKGEIINNALPFINNIDEISVPESSLDEYREKLTLHSKIIIGF